MYLYVSLSECDTKGTDITGTRTSTCPPFPRGHVRVRVPPFPLAAHRVQSSVAIVTQPKR
jgi:hypothetical protein